VGVRLVIQALGHVNLVVAEMAAEDVHQPVDVERLGDAVRDDARSSGVSCRALPDTTTIGASRCPRCRERIAEHFNSVTIRQA